MKTIIAPTDFTEVTNNAVHYAADLACVTGTDLLIVHTVQPPFSYNEVPVPDLTVRELHEAASARMEKLHQEIATKLDGCTDIHTDVRDGDMLTEIGKVCSMYDTYAVVLGTENKSGLEQFLFGNNTIDAIRELSWPLIVVPPAAKFASIRKVGLACDLLKVNDTIPQKEIADVIRAFNAELHILHVSDAGGDKFSPQKLDESARLLTMLYDLKPVYHLIENKDIEKGISEFAEKNQLDILITIPRSRKFPAGIFHHSHTKDLVLHSHIPVMSIHE
jgi:nucleotide-binding universal stress UspA family protein